MYGVLVGAAALVMAAVAAVGMVSVVTGWVPRWERRKVRRPRLWGYGALVSAVGMSVFVFLGPFDDTLSSRTVLAFAGLAVWVLGAAVQMMARRPVRTA
ncbi:hypothetical protein AB0942_06360 [Streptomyces nodosus]|uniref:hypothetical protein n=1 Tax=Streptomyces nodosus TaxID=40318 RepID=UPI0034550CFA